MTFKPESPGDSFDKAIRELEQGKVCPCYLIFGEDEFLIRDATNRLVNLLIPAQDRDLNLLVMDGEEADTANLCETLMTSPLLPGRKVVVVRRAPFFLSRQTAVDIIQKVRERLDTDPGGAGRDFMTFLAVAGWDLEDLADDGWKKISDETWSDMVTGDAGRDREQWLPKVVAYCREHNLKAHKGADDAEQLTAALLSGLPDGHFLILTATAADKRKRLFKTISEIGKVIQFSQPKGDARQKAQLMTTASSLLKANGKSLTEGAWTLLGQKTGFELQHSMSALEKLILHAGDRRVIDEKDVAGLVGKSKEDSVFSLTAALAEKKAALGLTVLHELIVQGVQPLMILAMLTREIRFLLQAKILLLYGPIKGFEAQMDFSAFQARIYPKIKAMAPSTAGEGQAVELAGLHPYVIFNTLKNTRRFSYEALIGCLDELAASDLLMKTTGKSPQLLLERFILRACSSS